MKEHKRTRLIQKTKSKREAIEVISFMVDPSIVLLALLAYRSCSRGRGEPVEVGAPGGAAEGRVER